MFFSKVCDQKAAAFTIMQIADFFFRDSPLAIGPRLNNVAHLSISLSAPGVTFTNRTVENFYTKSIRNLLRSLPQLRTLKLAGGYRYAPGPKAVG